MTDRIPKFDIDNHYVDLMLTFHENSKLRKVNRGGFEWVELPATEIEDLEGREELNTFLNASTFNPSDANAQRIHDLRLILNERKSIRQFSGAFIDAETLGLVVTTANGQRGEDNGALYRNPTAGNLRSCQPMIIAKGGAIGTCSLLIFQQNLIMEAGELDAERVEACFPETPCGWSAIVVIYSQISKLVLKYGIRGYKYALLDAGHLMQNIYLAAAAVGVAMHSSCGFFDDDLNDLLGLDGQRRSVAYVAFLGRGLSVPA